MEAELRHMVELCLNGRHREDTGQQDAAEHQARTQHRVNGVSREDGDQQLGPHAGRRQQQAQQQEAPVGPNPVQDPAQDAGALRQFFASILAQVRYARPSRDAPFTLELEFLA